MKAGSKGFGVTAEAGGGTRRGRSFAHSAQATSTAMASVSRRRRDLKERFNRAGDSRAMCRKLPACHPPRTAYSRRVPKIEPKVREQLDAFLASKNLRRTKQREVIIEAAFATEEHFNAEELLDMVRRIDRAVSRATVYRTLTLLVECGLLREVDLGRDQTYYDPNFLDKPQHNHLICKDCDRVVEFEDEHIALLEDCITRRLGFSPATKSIRIEANCNELTRAGRCRYQKAGPVAR